VIRLNKYLAVVYKEISQDDGFLITACFTSKLILERKMKFEYFKDTDTLYIDIKETTSVESKEISQGVVLDYDAEGNLTGIEIDNAHKVANLTKIETVALPLNDLVLA
jgi:uncharacterized protein YuzE